MFTPNNTPNGRFQVLRNGKRDWETATIQEVAQALRNFSSRPAENYDTMIRESLSGGPGGTIRLGDDWYRFYPF